MYAFILIVVGIACFILGFFSGQLFNNTKEIRNTKELRDADGYTNEEKHSWYRIVRYRNGRFDCIWESCIYDKRVADKRCAKLNDPAEGNEHFYGTYVVEKD